MSADAPAMDASTTDASKADVAVAAPIVAPAAPIPPAVKPPQPSPHRRRTLTFLGALLAILVIWEGSGFFFAYTDDAVLTSDLVLVAPQVTGPIQTLRVRDDQSVAVGDVLFTIDPTPIQLQFDQATDEVARAQSQITIDQAELNSAHALQASAVAQSQVAQSDLRRATDLTTSGFESSQAQQDAATAARRAADTLVASPAAVLRAQQTMRFDQIAISAAVSARAQFAFAFLVAFVQGPGQATSLTPPLERLPGVLIGSVMISVVILAWPSRTATTSPSSS
jgi:multidrug resistance efflux pump